MVVSVLHLSDIHAGPGALRDEDQKVAIPGNERHDMLDRLGLYVRSLPDAPDFLAVSGDITIQGDPRGLQEFRDWLIAGQEEGILPPPERTIVVPGNHDVRWPKADEVLTSAERFRSFYDSFARFVPHAWLPDLDPPTTARELPTSVADLVGGIQVGLQAGDPELRRSWPFVFDHERRVLIYGLNSARGSGERVDNAHLKTLEKLIAEGASRGLSPDAIDDLRSALHGLSTVDAAFVGEPQLEALRQTVEVLKGLLGDEWDEVTRIAVLHHHVAHLWSQQVETKFFESVIDAGVLKQTLIELGFSIVLHGHKHTNHVSFDASVIPLDRVSRLQGLCIVSGGTISGYPRIQDRQTFKIIKLDSDPAHRKVATCTEVPLVPTANPSYVVDHESRLYKLPISAPPQVHAMHAAKQRIDELLIHAVDTKGAASVSRGYSTLGPEGWFVATDAESRFKLLVDRPDGLQFVDVMLATKRLDFRQRSRVHWLLGSAERKAATEGRPWRLTLVVGDASRTTLSEADAADEVPSSLEQLRQWFAPAIDAATLELVVVDLDEVQVQAAIRTQAV